MTDALVPRASVIIPTFNRGSWLLEAVESVLQQSLRDLEVIVVDDGSTDGSADALDRIEDPRLRLFRQANAGAPRARGSGIDASRAPYIAFLDSDDRFHETKLEKQAALLDQRQEIGLVYTSHRRMDAMGRASKRVSRVPRTRVALDDLLAGPVFAFSSVLVRRSALDAAGPVHVRAPDADEWEWMIRLAMTGCEMEGLGETLVDKRVHESNLVRDPRAFADVVLASLRAVYADADMPCPAPISQEAAEAHARARFAGYAIAEGRPDEAAEHLREARTGEEPSADEIALRCAHIAQGLALLDPRRSVEQAAASLRRGDRPSKEMAASLRRQYYAVRTAASFAEHDRSDTLLSALRYVARSAPSVPNRGVPKMGLRALMGDWA